MTRSTSFRNVFTWCVGTRLETKKHSTLSDAAKVHIYSPDQEDCLLFHYEFTGRIKLNQVICQLTAEGGAISYLEDDFHLEINEDIYHQCVVQLSQIQRRESWPEISRKENGASSSRGRSLQLPHRYVQEPTIMMLEHNKLAQIGLPSMYTSS